MKRVLRKNDSTLDSHMRYITRTLALIVLKSDLDLVSQEITIRSLDVSICYMHYIHLLSVTFV